MSDHIEARLTALEDALALPHSANENGGALNAQLVTRVAELEKALARANYRILHLTRGIDELKGKISDSERK